MSESANSTAEGGRLRLLRRRVGRIVSRVAFYPRVEIILAIIAILIGMVTYTVLAGKGAPTEGFSPSTRTLLLIAFLLPLMMLSVLIARRVALLLGAHRRGRAGARLHVRLVGLFSAVAAIPTLLLVVFASLLFQFGVQFWFSDQARTVLENADQVARAYLSENKQRILQDIVAMGSDVSFYAREDGLEAQRFQDGLMFQVAARNLTNAVVFAPQGSDYLVYATANADKRLLTERILPTDITRANAGQASVITTSNDRVEAVLKLDTDVATYMYVSRMIDPQVINAAARTKTALTEYRALIARSRAMQWRFNMMLIGISLLILAATVMFALWLANRLSKPIGRLAHAAERVGSGDLTARVPVRGNPDELGTLARAFNRMARQLEAQTSALDRRRRFTETILAGVSAGVMSIDSEGLVRLANASAELLLETPHDALVGKPLADSVPELQEIYQEARAQGSAQGQVRIARGNDVQTLLVRISAETGGEGGYVLTFDDISQQLSDQRRAAWSDVARRIAHEIKNPLTPIQLSAERLQRRYGRHITQDPETFETLTSTIVRQVGDLRRMVDEFSSFARMPKPVFRAEPVLDIARQALFLHEVAHPNIRFTLTIAPDLPLFVCDRRQIAQALINLLKNAVEAVEAHGPDKSDGHILLTVERREDMLIISISDNGIGIPPELRERITEPYVTSRARGTGLGLAIVKKIVEEHDGTLEIESDAQSGTTMRMRFDMAALSAHLDHPETSADPVEIGSDKIMKA